MALDTECNLVIEAHGDESQRERLSQAIAHLRSRLLGEHLDTAPSKVHEEVAGRGSMIAAIDALRRRGRTLMPMNPVAPPELDALFPVLALFDPVCFFFFVVLVVLFV